MLDLGKLVSPERRSFHFLAAHVGTMQSFFFSLGAGEILFCYFLGSPLVRDNTIFPA